MQTAGKGVCGASQWSAARETARRANKLDEEGLEVAVCRHGVLLKGRNFCISPLPAVGAPGSHKGPVLLHRHCLQVLALFREGGSVHARPEAITADEAIPFHYACQGPFNQA